MLDFWGNVIILINKNNFQHETSRITVINSILIDILTELANLLQANLMHV